MSDSRISDLTAVVTPPADSELAIVVDGVTRKITVADLGAAAQLTTPSAFTGTATLTAGDAYSRFSAASVDYPVYLPAAASVLGVKFTCIKVDSTVYSITLTTSGGEVINSEDPGTTYILEFPGEYVVLQSNGVGYDVVGE